MNDIILDSDFLYTLKNGGQRCVIGWCMSIGIIASHRLCKKCAMPMKLTERKSISDGYEWFCGTKVGDNPHAISLSIRKGSWFEGSKLNLFQILLLTYYWVNKLPNKFILDDMHVSQHTVVSWKSLCRDICVEICMAESYQVGGPDKTVVVYLKKVDRKVYSKRNREGNYVILGYERESDKFFVQTIKEEGPISLLDVIKTFIFPETTIVSDCWKFYQCEELKEYTNAEIEHSYKFVDPSDENYVRINDTQTQSILEQMVPHWLTSNYLKLNFFESLWRRRYTSCNKMMIAFLDHMRQTFSLQEENS